MRRASRLSRRHPNGRSHYRHRSGRHEHARKLQSAKENIFSGCVCIKDISGKSNTDIFIGGPDASLVESFSGNITDISDSSNNETIKLGSFVGATMTSNNTYDQGAHVVVYAKFKDSTEQVVLETYV